MESINIYDIICVERSPYYVQVVGLYKEDTSGETVICEGCDGYWYTDDDILHCIGIEELEHIKWSA